jgi:hypothetical protein
MFDKLNYEDFCEILDTNFQLADAESDIKLKFFEISEKKETTQTIMFSLYLKSPSDVFLAQKIYNLQHEKYGAGSLFIVPIRQDADGGIVYESVFNRFSENQV